MEEDRGRVEMVSHMQEAALSLHSLSHISFRQLWKGVSLPLPASTPGSRCVARECSVKMGERERRGERKRLKMGGV